MRIEVLMHSRALMVVTVVAMVVTETRGRSHARLLLLVPVLGLSLLETKLLPPSGAEPQEPQKVEP